MNIIRWATVSFFLMLFVVELDASNKYVNDMRILNEADDSDSVEIEIKGNGEKCSLTFMSEGTIYSTNCRTMINSKGLKIYCSAHKRICKTYDEIYALVFSPIPTDIVKKDVDSKYHSDNLINDTQVKTNNQALVPQQTEEHQDNMTWGSLNIGINNPGEIKDWTYFGIKTPQEASLWIDALTPLGGVSYAGTARLWKQKGFSAQETKDWILLDIINPDSALFWIDSGVKTPNEAKEWKDIGINTPSLVFSWISSGINTPFKAKEWIDSGIKDSREVQQWISTGVNTAYSVKEWKKIGVDGYKEVSEWKKLGIETPEKVILWKNADIGTASKASSWIQSDLKSLEEIKRWQAIGVDDGEFYNEWKKYVSDIDKAKEWVDANYTLDDVKIYAQNNQHSPSDISKSKIIGKSLLLFSLLIVIFYFVKSLGSRQNTSIDEDRIVVVDIWEALSTVFGGLLIFMFINYYISFLLSPLVGIASGYIFLSSLLIFIIPLVKTWRAYSHGYDVNLTQKTFSFPASDVENSIWEILTMKSLRNLMHRETLKLEDIEALNNETKYPKKNEDTNIKGKKVYAVNVSGRFGSRQMVFNSKQKRDEFRALLNRSVRNLNGKIHSSDFNLDFQ